jgi:hypothetical protein
MDTQKDKKELGFVARAMSQPLLAPDAVREGSRTSLEAVLHERQLVATGARSPRQVKLGELPRSTSFAAIDDLLSRSDPKDVASSVTLRPFAGASVHRLTRNKLDSIRLPEVGPAPPMSSKYLLEHG